MLTAIYRGCVVILIGSYLTLSAWYFQRHLVGDQQPCPLQYAFTWDMFPNYPMWSSRRFAIVKTQSGNYFRIFPGTRQQFRRGHSGTHSRFDLPRDDSRLKAAVAQAVEDFARVHTDDPPRYVFVCERYWPVGANALQTRLQFEESENSEAAQKFVRVIDEGPIVRSDAGRWQVRWGQP